MKIKYKNILIIIPVLIFSSCKKEPVSDFTWSPYNAITNEEIQFENKSEDAKSYLWDFGDGVSSTDENPTHTYTGIGEYTVSLVSENGNKQHTVSKTINLLSLWGLIPDGGFESSNTFDYWQDTQFSNGTISKDNSIKVEGNSSLYVNVAQQYWIDLDHIGLDIERNTDYEFSFWYKYNGYKYSTDYPIMIGMRNESNDFLWTGGSSFGNEYMGYVGDTINVEWTKYTKTFNSGESLRALLFIGICMENTWMDEITLRKSN